MWLASERLLPCLFLLKRLYYLDHKTKVPFQIWDGLIYEFWGSIQSEIVVKFFCFVFKVIEFNFFLFLQKSQHVLEHLLKSDIPCVASKMSRFCINLEGITKSESGSVLSKATKVSGSD